MRDSRLVAADAVQLPLHHNRGSLVRHRPARFINSEQHTAFSEQRGLRAVHIFAALIIWINQPPAEANHPPRLIENGKHEPFSEPVINRSPLRAGHQSGLLHQLERNFLLRGPFLQRVKTVGGKSDLKGGYGFRLQPAGSQISAPGLTALMLHQNAVIELRDPFVDFEQLALVRAFSVTVFKIQLHADAVGQHLQSDHEIDLLIFLNKTDHIAAGVAAEAVIDLPVGTHRKRRGFLFVKRAERLKARPGILERKVRTDYIRNIVARPDFINGFSGNLFHSVFFTIKYGQLHHPRMEPRRHSITHPASDH